jgi:anthranilate phosphoribosyltransferase
VTPQDALERLAKRAGLLREEARAVFLRVMRGEVSPAQLAAILMGLRAKGETGEELAGAVSAVRESAVRVEIGALGAVDTCGTGGDGLATVNISTAAAFVVAGAGVPVAKHGNRSASGRVGSADVLAALGVPVERPAGEVARAIRERGFGFMFAPAFHPAMKHAAPVRKELGIRTIFNLVGPLANPALPPYQVIGVPEPRFVRIVADALTSLGVRRALVVHGAGGADEATLAGENLMARVEFGRVHDETLESRALGLAPAPVSALAGGDASANAAAIVKVLKGGEGPVADTVLLNAALAIWTAGAAPSIAEGLESARESVRSSRALRILEGAKC